MPPPGSAGKMATPGMSWQQHYYGGSAAGAAKFVPSQQAGHSLDYSPDLHLKMSKKIAQLTKVRGRGGRGGTLCGPRGAHLPAGRLRALRPGRVGGGCFGGRNTRRLASRSRSNLGSMLATSICRRQLRGTAGLWDLHPAPFTD